MALIQCSDCGNKVSTAAVSCPKCGAPVSGADEAIAAGAPLTTTQFTSKKIKTHQLVAVLLIIIGGIWLAVAAGQDARSEGAGAMPMLVIFIGMVWYLVARIRTWWHHG